MTPIERAARALCKLEGHPENINFESKPMWQSYLRQAMAVADALQEPSRMMVEAGAEILRTLSADQTKTASEDDAANVWRLMIDVLREEAL